MTKRKDNWPRDLHDLTARPGRLVIGLLWTKLGGCLVKIKKIEILLLNQILHHPQIRYDAESQNMAKKMKKIIMRIN